VGAAAKVTGICSAAVPNAPCPKYMLKLNKSLKIFNEGMPLSGAQDKYG